MNVNLINGLNPTVSHQSDLVETNLTNNGNDCFQQLLQQSENQTEHNKKTVNAKLKGIDDAQEDNDHNVEMLITEIYPFNIQTPIAQDSDIKIDQNTETLNVNLFDGSSSEVVIDEQATHLLTSIYDSEDLINKVASQTGIKTKLVDKGTTNIKDNINNFANSKNESHKASEFMQKVVMNQVQLINNYDDEGQMATNQEPFLLANTNGQNQLLSQTSISARSATINLPTQNIMQWQTSLTEQIIMFNRQGIQTAEIKLHPQELGSMYIKLAMNDDKMNLHMMAAHSAVKGMLESALPFLRTSLEDQGITLEQTNIGDFSMMNDSKQSDTPQQTKSNQTQKVVSLDVIDDSIEQSLVESRSIKSRLSIFA
ncbi:MAG: flagellar hook-length control protein FliK [Gilliamella sp.]|nr:flagellar hook-length control protein FliK [Gilliamella sp.]